MARIRTIKPEFPHSESMGRVSREARLLFLQIWTLCDDSGRTRASSRMLASLLYPYDDDAPDLIGGWMDELERESCVIRYEHDGSSYLEVCNWLKHQRIDRPTASRLPNPREPSRILASPPSGSGREGKGMEGNGREDSVPVDNFVPVDNSKVKGDDKNLRSTPLPAIQVEGLQSLKAVLQGSRSRRTQ